jgi:hypothetical protein
MRIPIHSRDGVCAYALIDDADFARLNQHRWCFQGEDYPAYRVGPRARQRTVYMHQAVLGIAGVDHVNGDHLDNRRSNLRAATRAQNAQNLRLARNNTSGFRGVSRREGRWRARATVKVRRYELGYFDTVEEADGAVKAFRAEHMPFSEDARIAA